MLFLGFNLNLGIMEAIFIYGILFLMLVSVMMYLSYRDLKHN